MGFIARPIPALLTQVLPEWRGRDFPQYRRWLNRVAPRARQCCGPYFDTLANGFENIGGRTGPAGSSLVWDRSRPIAVDTIAHLVAFELRPGVQLDQVEMEAIANDVVFGIMGAAILKDSDRRAP